MFPENRMRRMRTNPKLIELVNETELNTRDFITPLFFDENINSIRNTESMPGVETYPLSGYENIANRLQSKGLDSVLLFGIPAKKDCTGSEAYNPDGVVQKAISGIKDSSDMLVIADLCMCEYTDHGHCGLIDDKGIDNDSTLEIYGKIAVSQADAGADMIAPSGMMDGQIAAIRTALDDAGHKNIPIMAYSAKFYSSFYGPFRDVACGAPQFGNRSSYQMNCGNFREAMIEMELDVAEGADILMVKPAGSYLDIIREASVRFDLPIAAYQVSGEYAMIKAAGMNGWIDEDRVMMESLTCIKRAGADMIITYFAEQAADILRDSR